MAQGQRVYTLTSNNANELANITIDDGARTEIQQALNLGLEVTVHQSPITVNGWQGSGYAILDAEYGVGAYQISGGVSGGFLSDGESDFLMYVGFSAALVGGLLNILPLVLFAAAISSMLIVDLYLDFQMLDSGCDGLEMLVLASVTASVVSIFAAPLLLAIVTYTSFVLGKSVLAVGGSAAC